MNSPIHILNQLGILSSFSIAKKITEEDINKYYSKHKKLGKNNSQIGKMLSNKIMDDIQKAIKTNKIPGIVSEEELMESVGVDPSVIKNIPDLNKIITVVSEKLSEKNYDKMSLCYFINSLVNILNLTEEDFTDFHKQNGDDDDDESNDGENDEFIGGE